MALLHVSGRYPLIRCPVCPVPHTANTAFVDILNVRDSLGTKRDITPVLPVSAAGSAGDGRSLPSRYGQVLDRPRSRAKRQKYGAIRASVRRTLRSLADGFAVAS